MIQIFTRRGEGAPRVTGAAAIGGYRSRQGDARHQRLAGPFDYAVSLAAEKSDGVSAVRPGDAFGTFNPDDDGFSRKSGSLRLGWTPGRRAIGSASACSRAASNAQYDSAEFDAQFNPDPSPDFRNRLKTRVAALDYRGAVTGSWTTSVQLGHSVDDSDERRHHDHPVQDRARPGDLAERARARARPAARARLRVPATSAPAATPSPSAPKRHNNALVAGYSGRFDALGVQADVRRDDNSAYGGNTTGRARPELRADARAEAAGARRHDLPRADLQRPVLPGLRHSARNPGFEIKPERGRSFEIGASWESGDTRLSVTAYRNEVQRPDRLRARHRRELPAARPLSAGLRLRLRRATSAAPGCRA